MNKWRIVAVLGRPSPSTSEFFNSIKFHIEEVEADYADQALFDAEGPSSDSLADGYEVLNWYAFREEEQGEQGKS